MLASGQLNLLAGALFIGLLIGLERGWTAREQPAGSRVAGFRTFALLGLAGGVAGLLPPIIGAVIALGVTGLLLIGYYRASVSDDRLSATNGFAAMLTFALGMMAVTGFQIEAFAAAAITTLILAMRGQMHGLLKGMSAEEVGAVGRFALLALVILPLMPDQTMGPYNAWNPRQIWLVVVLVCGLSFIGYVAARRTGPTRGLLMTALTGAIVSSTAVTAAFSRKLVQPSDSEGALIAGIALASTTMFVRVLILSAGLLPWALPYLALAMIPATIVSVVMAGLALRHANRSGPAEPMPLGNPLDFGPALYLAGFVAVLAVVSRWAEAKFGGAGIAVLLGITGMADVDAAVITMAGLPRDMLDPRQAGLILSIPVLANTTLKAFLAMLIARNRRGVRAAMPLLASVAASGIALLFLF